MKQIFGAQKMILEHLAQYQRNPNNTYSHKKSRKSLCPGFSHSIQTQQYCQSRSSQAGSHKYFSRPSAEITLIHQTVLSKVPEGVLDGICSIFKLTQFFQGSYGYIEQYPQYGCRNAGSDKRLLLLAC